MIWLFLGLLSFFAAVIMGMPLLRQEHNVSMPFDTTPAVLLDQLDEVQRDLNRGVISALEAKAAEQEIKRRILMQSRKTVSEITSQAKGGRTALILSALFVPVFAAGYYASMGSPEVSNIAFAERAAERQDAAQIADLSSQLYDKLVSDPQGGPSEGWMLLGQTYSRMGRFTEAAEAFEIVSKRPEATSPVFSMLAEALIYADQGVVTLGAERAIDRATALDPANPAGVFYKAVALQQKGEAAQAYELLVSRLHDAGGFFPWMESFVVEANRIGAEIGKSPISLASFAPILDAPGPTREDVANAKEMSQEDRQEFIQSMVERLATRLEEEPEDVDGWMRLGNAFSVLGESKRAIDAFGRADALLSEAPASDPRRRAVKESLSKLRN